MDLASSAIAQQRLNHFGLYVGDLVALAMSPRPDVLTEAALLDLRDGIDSTARGFVSAAGHYSPLFRTINQGRLLALQLIDIMRSDSRLCSTPATQWPLAHLRTLVSDLGEIVRDVQKQRPGRDALEVFRILADAIKDLGAVIISIRRVEALAGAGIEEDTFPEENDTLTSRLVDLESAVRTHIDEIDFLRRHATTVMEELAQIPRAAQRVHSQCGVSGVSHAHVLLEIAARIVNVRSVGASTSRAGRIEVLEILTSRSNMTQIAEELPFEFREVEVAPSPRDFTSWEPVKFSPWIQKEQLIQLLKDNKVPASDRTATRRKAELQSEDQKGTFRFRIPLAQLKLAGLNYPDEWNRPGN